VGKAAAETGALVLDATGRIRAAGWTVGIAETVEWVQREADRNSILFVDAPLIVENESGQRLCEKQVGQRYGRWRVSANSTNRYSPRLAGVRLREQLESRGWRYSSGSSGPARCGRTMSECYPYTTLVGAMELGYEVERPRYKRKPKRMPAAEWNLLRCAACDDLVQRLAALTTADPPLDLRSHPETRRLLDEPAPTAQAAYKHREDLIDAALCAWTAAYWWRHGTTRCQVLGLLAAAGNADRERLATIIAPTRSRVWAPQHETVERFPEHSR
jgi:predicted RNase H-like nuclease